LFAVYLRFPLSSTPTRSIPQLPAVVRRPSPPREGPERISFDTAPACLVLQSGAPACPGGCSFRPPSETPDCHPRWVRLLGVLLAAEYDDPQEQDRQYRAYDSNK